MEWIPDTNEGVEVSVVFKWYTRTEEIDVAKAKSTKQSCDCIGQVNKQLDDANSNTWLDVPMRINFSTGKVPPSRVAIATVKADSKKRIRKKTVIATYCPFCGVKYAE